MREPSRTIDVVRGRMTPERAEQLVGFWVAHGEAETAARRRLGEVVCVLLDPGEVLVGVVRATPAIVELVGGQRLWIYQDELPAGADQPTQDALLRVAFSAIAADFDPEDPRAPVGLCLLIADLTRMRARPQAEWDDPRMFYAGYLGDGRQVRVGYFDGSRLQGAARA